ncbi:hypothetical protein Amet_2895 [Alkaliphilus metalliredigens QYMF]|uniref:Lipoprotein n=1 Tax=Alkaliphilus metalliredigens (strain QYMF) TaxID=293826 RepID=A6TS77_ALKMQ|nr:hypothetical protein [Alkaliphilus metalliredigens]ABR49045.1 hypothetical protein Amet_2895 [Alkaliphilus metalliredigens QYMF]
MQYKKILIVLLAVLLIAVVVTGCRPAERPVPEGPGIEQPVPPDQRIQEPVRDPMSPGFEDPAAPGTPGAPAQDPNVRPENPVGPQNVAPGGGQ